MAFNCKYRRNYMRLNANIHDGNVKFLLMKMREVVLVKAVHVHTI